LTSKVKLRKWLLTALMTSNIDHIHIIGRYSQGQHTLVTSRSQGQCQGQEGRCRFLAVFTRFANFSDIFDWRMVIFLCRTFQWVCWACWTMLSDLLSTLAKRRRSHIPRCVFFSRPFIFSGIVGLPKAQKIVGPDF